MIVLVINAGSSSLKYQLIRTGDKEVLARGNADRIGLDNAFIRHYRNASDPIEIPIVLSDHTDAIKAVITVLLAKETGVIKSLKEIEAIGHRVVHGGEKFATSVLITPEVKAAIKAVIPLAPLHNPPNITGIEACEEAMPGIPQVAVFDTAFHQTMPPEAFMYALPYEIYEEHRVRKYGFHGTSHEYVAKRAAEVLDRPFVSLKIITCHLGNGSSLAAVKHGECVDTSMGFTPLEGVPMGTRCGSIDPAIVTFLMGKEGLDTKGIDNLMNKKSGVLGISGISSDFRDIENATLEGNKRAELALQMFEYQCKKVIGSFAAAMGGVDAIVFTAGIGENVFRVRKNILSGLEFLGVKLDNEKNNTSRGVDAILSTADSSVAAMLIPTNEELAIAMATREICSKL